MKTCFECNLIYIYHSLSVEPETKKKGKHSASESQDQQGMILICTIFLLKFSITKIWICRRSQSIEPAAKKKSKQGTTESAGSARYYYWFLLVLTQIVNWNSHLVADLLRCQFCTQWKHVSYQMHGNSHKKWLMSIFDFVISLTKMNTSLHIFLQVQKRLKSTWTIYGAYKWCSTNI